MDFAEFKTNNIDPVLKKNYVIFYMVYIIANILGYSIGILFPSPFPKGILIFDVIIIVTAIVSTILFLTDTINIHISTLIFSFMLAANIITSDQYVIFNCMSEWEYILFRDAFILSISLITTGFICNYISIIIQSFAYVLMLILSFLFSLEKNLSIDIFIFLTLFVCGFSFAIVAYKRAMLKALKRRWFLRQEVSRRDNEILQKEIEFTKDKSKHLEEIVKQKERELTTYALLIARFNERDKHLKKEIQKFPELSKDEQLKKIKEINIDLLIGKDLNSWQKFRKRFEEVHPDFLKKLTKKYPSLSPSEQKLATLIKLGLASKEIASITYNTKESIDVARSRLRKKLKLDRTQNIEFFLNKI